MAREIEWSERALEHLVQIAEFIGRHSETYAKLTVSRIISRVEQVSEFPQSGRVIPERENPDLREIFWQDYRIVYRVFPEKIAIAGVTHGSVNLEEFLRSIGEL